ncbi:hypothetical protein OAI07_01990 [Akkermansiaceae bacterium]|nr:hypothetical protein [Akkermansiaceae bacterium]
MVYTSFAFLFCSYSCVNKRIERSLTEHVHYQARELSKADKFVFNENSIDLSWNEAEELLFAGNIRYRTSQASLKNAEQRKKDIWLDLLPDIQAFINLSASFAGVGNFSGNDINAGLSSRLRIPSPIALYRDSYRIGIQIISERYAHELLRRNLTRDLYRLFKESEMLKSTIIENQKMSGLEDIPLDRLPEALSRQSDQKKRLVTSRERFRLKINRLLNTPGKSWSLTGKLPAINYQSRINGVKLENGFGSLGLKIRSVQIEAAITGIKLSRLNRLPSVTINTTAPVLFDSSRGGDFDFDGEDFNLFTNLFKNIELDDVFDKKDIRNAEFRFKINRERLAINFEQEASQVKINKLAYKGLLKKKGEIEIKLKELKKGRGSREPHVIMDDFKISGELKTQYELLNRQLLHLDLEFWIWDENYWIKN